MIQKQIACPHCKGTGADNPMMLLDAINVKVKVVLLVVSIQEEDITIYLLKHALDAKEKDKLLAKYVESAEDKI